MIALYMDENVQGAISRELRQRGIDVLTVQEDGRSGLPDPQILDRAQELGRVLFTHDDDLLAEATTRLRTNANFAGVIFAHQEKVSIGKCVEDLELICLAEEFAEYHNRIQYLPLR